jgi:hypothetical protein
MFVCADKAMATEELLVSISSDVYLDSYQLGVDSIEIDHSISSFYIDNYLNGKIIKRMKLSVNEFIANGVKLTTKDDIVFASINGENFQKEQGGMIVIDALYNALNGSRKRYELHLAKDRSGWRLYNSGHLITKIKAIANKIPVVGVVGAKDLIMN